MATRLKKLRLTELSLVDNPANADAVVMLTKRYEEPEDIQKDDDLDDDDLEDEEFDDEEMVDGAADDAADDEDEGEDDLDDDAADDEETEDEGGDDDDSDGESVGEDDNASTTSEDGMTKSMSGQPQTEEEILKSLPESVRKRLEDAEAVAKAASEAVAKLNEEKAQAEAVTLAKSYLGKASGDADVLGTLLRKASDEEKAEIAKLLKAHNAALSAAQVFTAVGDTGSETDEVAQLNKRATEIRKSNPKITPEQAIAMALEENPDAYVSTL